MSTQIEWKPCYGFNRYEVSRCGSIRNARTGKILSPFRQNRGYLQIRLTKDDGSQGRPTIHRLVAIAFIGASNLEVNHIDLNKSNNHVNNLEYVTHKQNIKHAIISGAWRNRTRGHSKITEKDVKAIRSIHKEGRIGYAEIAKLFPAITKSNVAAIVSMRSWKDV